MILKEYPMAKAKTKIPAAEINAPSSVAYDNVPYTSHPFPQTNPLLLQSIARLFGLTVPAPQKARILEIGCASGGNIISIASCYPQSRCVGIDYSQKQIEAGRADVKALGLKNLKLEHMSVTDITKAFGEFDYIITHGVMSWVPADVQEKILEVCKTNLAPDGIAFISYNTLPGWNSVRSLRDIMLFHTSHFPEPAAKVQQARLLLKFLSESTKASKSPLAAAIDREIQLLAGQPDYYIMHEHLEENNTAFYFHEFMAKASAHGLQYVADTSIESMYSGNLPEETAKVLATSMDIVRTEQFMDFISDRRFRQTLLCHNDRILNRNMSTDIMREGVLSSRFGYPEGFGKHDIMNGAALEFQAAGNLKLKTSDPVLLAMLQVFSEHNRELLPFDQLAKLVRAKLKNAHFVFAQGQEQLLEETLSLSLMRYLFIGGFHFYLGTFNYVASVSKKPVASVLARYQVKTQEWISNQCQECKYITAFDRFLINYLDGTRDMAALIDAMLPHFASKELVMREDDVPLEDMAVIRKRLTNALPDRLKAIADMAILVA